MCLRRCAIADRPNRAPVLNHHPPSSLKATARRHSRRHVAAKIIDRQRLLQVYGTEHAGAEDTNTCGNDRFDILGLDWMMERTYT